MPTGPAYLDPIGGYNAAAAILTALVARQATGLGQYIEMSQVEAAMPFVGELILDSLETGISPNAHGNRVAHAAPHDAYPALGVDAWVAISVANDDEWRKLAEMIGAPHLGIDPRYATMLARRKNQDELREPISSWTRHIMKQDAAARLQAAGIAAAPVQDGKDIVEDTYLSRRGFFTALDHPEAGRRTYQGLPFKLSRTPGGQYRAAPCLGEHTEVILRDILRLSESDIAALEQSGTISNVPPGAAPRSTKVERAKTSGGARA